MPIRKPHSNAKNLRKDMPQAERILWARVKNKQLGGLRFRRQHTIGPYIADFACIAAKLVIELDGEQHALGETPLRDAKRNAFMEANGWTVLRFWNHEIYENLERVLETILDRALTSKHTLEIEKLGKLERE